MPLSPVITVYGPDGKALSGPVKVEDRDTPDLSGFYGEEFSHRVYTILKDYFYALLYGTDFVRKHEPMTIVKQIDKTSVPLMKYFISGAFLPKVEVRWDQYNEKNGRTEEYFRMTLEHARLHSIKYRIPDVKDTALERYGHLEELQFMYQKITWLFVKGHLTFTDIWNGGFFKEEDEKDFSGKKNPDDEEGVAGTPVIEPLKLKFTSGIFEEPKDGFAFGKKAAVKFTYTSNRKPDNKENKVYVKFYAVYNGKTEDLHLTNEGRLVNGDSWSTEFKLKKPELYEKDTNRKPDAAVEYYAEIENQAAGGNFKGESISVPKGTGTPELKKMEWKSPCARRDESVTFAVEFTGCNDGENATVEIYEFDQDGKHDFMEKIESKVTGGKLEAEWKFVYEEDTDDILSDEEAKKTGGRYNPPEYFFTVTIGKDKFGEKQESGLLQFKDWIEVELQDEAGNPIANEPFEIHLPDGSTQNGTLDEKGFARVNSVPPGPVEVVFKNHPSVTIKK
jgi:type VI protein secretion system component Hcp